MPSAENGIVDDRTVLEVFSERPIANTLTVLGGTAVALLAAEVFGPKADHLYHETKDWFHDRFSAIAGHIRHARQQEQR